jgi:hypothetical protein
MTSSWLHPHPTRQLLGAVLLLFGVTCAKVRPFERSQDTQLCKGHTYAVMLHERPEICCSAACHALLQLYMGTSYSWLMHVVRWLHMSDVISCPAGCLWSDSLLQEVC